MQSLQTQCPTCGSRLRLRDERLLGQILPCPKCHGMVMIESAEALAGAPDPQLHVGSASEVDSQTVTAEALQPPPDAVESIHAPASEDSFATAPPLPSWESDKARRTRQIAAVVALSLIGLLGSLGIFAVFVHQYQQSQRDVAQAPVEEAAAADDGANEPSVAEQADTPAGENGSGPDADTARAADAAAGPSQSAGDAARGAGPSDGGTAADPAASEPEPGEEAVSIVDGTDRTLPGEPSRELADPTSSDAFEQALRAGERPLGPAPVDAPAEETDLVDQLPAGLQSLVPILDLAAADSLSPPPVAELKPTLDLEGPQQQDESLHPEPARPVSIPRALDRRLRGANFSDVPLAAATAVASQLTGAPIYLDLPLSDAAGIDPATPVSLAMKEATSGALVGALAQSAGCAPSVVDDAFIALQPAAPSAAQFLAPAFSVTDITDDADALAAQLSKWFGDGPLKLKANPLRGELAVEGPPDQRFAVALALEAARGMTNATPRLPRRFTDRWLQPTPTPEAEARPQAAVLRSPDRATAIPMLLRHLATAADSVAVIDWPSCWTHGLTPTATALPLFLSQDPYEEAERLLSPYALEIVRCSDSVWWITTAEAFDSGVVYISAEVPVGMTVDEFISQLRSFAASDENVQYLVLPQVADRVVVRLPRYLARQLTAVTPAETALTQN